MVGKKAREIWLWVTASVVLTQNTLLPTCMRPSFEVVFGSRACVEYGRPRLFQLHRSIFHSSRYEKIKMGIRAYENPIKSRSTFTP